ncbi:MAG TPA: methyltransferase domain-containing protein [Acidimicrobiales bacterium]
MNLSDLDRADDQAAAAAAAAGTFDADGGGAGVRTEAFGQGYDPGPVDRLGVWLSARRVRHHVARLADDEGRIRRLALGDVGCGYQATIARSLLESGEVAHAVLADVDIAPDLQAHPQVTALAGALPGVLDQVPDRSLDVVLCLSVLEHLWDPETTLRHLHRITRPGGVVLVNVPSWRGKRFLELSAFRLGTSPRGEMDDHKAYYDPRDLWPLLVRAGFLPSGISCTRHKLGLNTFAACTVPR